MTDQTDNRNEHPPHGKARLPKPPVGTSIRHQLVLAVNLAVVLTLVAFFAWEYVYASRQVLREKRTSLRDEAETLVPGVLERRDDAESLQQYIDNVCGRMRDASSPGHHIVVRVGDVFYQAHAHHRQSEGLLEAVRRAADSERTAPFGGEDVIASKVTEGTVTVYISEYLSNIREMLLAQLAQRALSILVLAVMLAVLINVLVHRMATRPIRRFVDAVREIRGGRFGVQARRPRIAELRFLADEFNTMSAELERADRNRKTQMEKARRIQSNLIPTRRAVRPRGINFLYEPAEDVGGDFFDVISYEDDSHFVYIADVSGHGVPAALGAAMLKMLFDTHAKPCSGPDAVIKHVHDAFAAATLDEDFATAFLLRWDPQSNSLTYVSAGHAIAYLLTDEGDIQDLEATGPLLGADIDVSWRSKRINPDAKRLVMVTDGVLDLQSESGERYGDERLRAVLHDTADEPLDILFERLRADLHAFRGDGHQTDDMTVLAINLQEGRP